MASKLRRSLKKWARLTVLTAAAGGFLFSGPCGITALQFQDFAVSALVRTFVTSLASVVEAAAIEAAIEDRN